MKNAFHKNKKPISINKVKLKRILLSKKDPYDRKRSFKYFIGYINETDVFPVPLCIKLPKIIGYVWYAKLFIMHESFSLWWRIVKKIQRNMG